MDGTFLVRENMVRQLPFVLFLTFLGMIYIGNRFHAERMVRQINELKTEVGNLRSEQITTTSELMNISRPSEVAALVESKGLGLKESMEPPKKLKTISMMSVKKEILRRVAVVYIVFLLLGTADHWPDHLPAGF